MKMEFWKHEKTWKTAISPYGTPHLITKAQRTTLTPQECCGTEKTGLVGLNEKKGGNKDFTQASRIIHPKPLNPRTHTEYGQVLIVKAWKEFPIQYALYFDVHCCESRWRNSQKVLRGHDKPIHGSCAVYFPGGITNYIHIYFYCWRN